MFVKENTDAIKLIRPVENQIIRTAENYEKLFEDAGLQVVFKRSQIWQETFERCCDSTLWVLSPLKLA
jgi:hypothetical protein